jgi:hypothetical protein
MIFGGAESYLGPPYKFLGGPPRFLRPWVIPVVWFLVQFEKTYISEFFKDGLMQFW